MVLLGIRAYIYMYVYIQKASHKLVCSMYGGPPGKIGEAEYRL